MPEKLIDVTLQPLMFVLLFAYVFGGAIHVSGGSYHEYLMGGIIVQTLAFAIMGTAVGLADDMGKGVVDRFRSLPMARSAVLAGRALADIARQPDRARRARRGRADRRLGDPRGRRIGDRRLRAGAAVRLRHDLGRDPARTARA